MKTSIPCPYLCQYDNQIYPGGSCNMTSAGMALLHYGKTVPGAYARIPDNLLAECDAKGLDRHALEVIAQVLREHGLVDEASYTDKLDQVKQHVLTGELAIVQGAFTASGHVIVVCGVDEEAGVWICNDPAGDHTAPNGYRNPGWRPGDHVRYPSSWFSPAAAPDGNCWAHLLKKAE